MDKIRILVGKYCLERPNVLLELSKRYMLYTTDMIYSKCMGSYLTDVKIISFTENEMLQYTTFISEHPYLQKIGFLETGILFTALRNKIIVAVTDKTTRQACHELGIKIVEVNGNSEVLESNKNKNESNGSLEISNFKKFIRAAYL